MKKICIFVLFAFLLIGCTVEILEEEDELTIKINKYQASLVAVGDNLIHSSVYQAAAIDDGFDFSPMLGEIKPYIKPFDLAFINQETILGGKDIGLSSYPCFNSPYELGDNLVDAGFNLISIANNHTLDRGEQAVINAINYWESKPVVYSGASKSPSESRIKTFNNQGITFAFVAYTYGTNGIPHPGGKTHLANIYDNDIAQLDIESVRDEVDVIIVSMHWGSEYEDYPNQTQKSQALFLSSLGVDIIIGHHPHVIQPVEMIVRDDGRKTFAIYSLGNFLSDQKGIDRLIGMAISIDITKTVIDDNIIIELKNPHAKLLYRHKDYVNNSFHIKLFSDLNNDFLIDYQSYFMSKQNLIQSYYSEITVS